MDKITEVELRLDGFHLHPDAESWKGHCYFGTLQSSLCEGKPVPPNELVPITYEDYYVLVCKGHVRVLVGKGRWTLYHGQNP
jgi:hypothetical protein